MGFIVYIIFGVYACSILFLHFELFKRATFILFFYLPLVMYMSHKYGFFPHLFISVHSKLLDIDGLLGKAAIEHAQMSSYKTL